MAIKGTIGRFKKSRVICEELEIGAPGSTAVLTGSEFTALDGITAGTVLASKALIVDASKDLSSLGAVTFGSPQVLDHNTTITAFATGGQASAVALTGQYNNVTTCATDGDSVKLLTAAAGQIQTVKNSGATSLAVFPNTSDSINALAVNLSVNIPPGGETTFRAISATVWETNEVFVSSAPTTLSGEFIFKASDSAGDTVTTLTNASHGQATVVTVPDMGLATSYVVQSTAAITAVEADVLDGATAGTAVASKALVVDASKDLTGMGYINSIRPVIVDGTTITILAADSGGLIVLDSGAAAAFTLPTATAGLTYDVVVPVTTHASTTFTCAAGEFFEGAIIQHDTDTAASETTTIGDGSADDVLTLNGTTTGGIAGSWMNLTCVTAGKWMCSGNLLQSGTVGDAFSAP